MGEGVDAGTKAQTKKLWLPGWHEGEKDYKGMVMVFGQGGGGCMWT